MKSEISVCSLRPLLLLVGPDPLLRDQLSKKSADSKNVPAASGLGSDCRDQLSAGPDSAVDHS